MTAVRAGGGTIADAICSVAFELEAPAELMPGDLVVLRARPGPRLSSARVVQRIPCSPPPPDGEHARLSAGAGERLAARARAIAAIRDYFVRERFVEVETPVNVRTPGLDAYVDAIATETGFLTTSPELQMKRLLVAGLPRIFQFARVSRAFEHGPWHEPEFSMLEWYRAFADQTAVMTDTEQIVHRVVSVIAGGSWLELAGGRRLDVAPPFDRLTVAEAFREHASVNDVADLAASDEDRFFQLLVDRVEPALAGHPRPVFLCDYPLSQAALARPNPEDPRFAERFELYVGGVELCNGFSELTDPAEQRRRFEKERARRQSSGAPVYAIDERFMAALCEGMPPSAGNALGLDRLIALATGAAGVADVLAFPAAWL